MLMLPSDDPQLLSFTTIYPTDLSVCPNEQTYHLLKTENNQKCIDTPHPVPDDEDHHSATILTSCAF